MQNIRVRIISSAVLLSLALTAMPTRAAQMNFSAVTSQTPHNAAEMYKLFARIIDTAGRRFEISGLVVDRDTGQVLFQLKDTKPMLPASNWKLFTTAAALDRLGPNFQVRTSVYAASAPDASGTVTGDIILYGRGDGNISARFSNGDYTQPLKDLAAQLESRGVKRITGNIVGDSSYFSGPNIGDGRTDDDLQWYFGAETTALSLDENSIDVVVAPGARAGAAAVITLGPQTSYMQVINNARTVARGRRRSVRLGIHRDAAKNLVAVWGTVAVGQDPVVYHIAVHNPTLFAATVFKDVLNQQGIAVGGQPVAVDYAGRAAQLLDFSKLNELAYLTSVPLSQEVQIINKESNNLHAELLLRQLGVSAAFAAGTLQNQPSTLTSDQLGIGVVRDYLRKAGISSDGLVINDGSGLSRNDRVTPHAIVSLLRYVNSQPYAATFQSSLPIAATDGTLRNRFLNTPAAGNLLGKTGDVDTLDDLSGYVTTASGKRLVFNFAAGHTDPSLHGNPILDALATVLARF